MSINLPDDLENLEAKNLINWIEYYDKENAKYEKFFQMIGFDKSDLLLRENCHDKFQTLVSMAYKFKLERVDRISYMTALQEKQSNILNAKQAIYELTNENTQINEKIYKLNVVKDALIKDLNTLMEKIPKDKQYTEEIESKIEFRKGKIEKYRAEIEELKLELLDTNLTHESIMCKYESLKEMNVKLKELTAELNVFDDLQPSVNLANLKLEKLRNEIMEADKEIEKLMNSIAL